MWAALQKYVDTFNTKLQSEGVQSIMYNKDDVDEQGINTFKGVDKVDA